jgi:hypothetical protein
VTGAPSDSSDSQPRRTNILWACFWLSLALVGAFPGFAGYGFYSAGAGGVSAALVAGGVCWVGATAALVLSAMFRSPEQALVGLLMGMFFRMGLPLAAGFVLIQSGGPLVEAGVIPLLVGYYLVALVVETLLSLRFIASPVKVSKAA